MATLTLGQMLDAALGSSRAGVIDFEQLHNLLNGMLLHLGLRDLAVQENGEPLEGGEESPFAFLKELKQKVEANEKEIAEIRALCQQLNEEVSVMKMEQSRMAEDMQQMQQNFSMENLQNMMEDLRNQLLSSLMDMIQGQGSPDGQKNPGSRHLRQWDDQELIVIGNEIPLVERPKTPLPRHGDCVPGSPPSPKAKTQGRGKDALEANASSPSVSSGANDMGQSDMGWKGMGWNMGQKDMRRNVQWSDTGQSDMGQNDMGRNVGQKDMKRNVRWSDTGQDDMGQDDMGQDGMGQDGMGQDDIGQDDMGQNDMGQDDMGQIKDEEVKIRISKVEALPSPLDSPPETTSMGEIKDEEIKTSISKAPPHVQKKSSDRSFTASGMHPRAPGTPVQRVQSVRGHPGSQTLWIPSESVAGTSSGPSTSKDARGGRSLRMEQFPTEAGLMLLKAPSSEYSPCDPLVKWPSRRSEFVRSTPPPSPGFSGRLPRARRQPQAQEHRKQAAEGYSRRSPMYCGGKHTSVCPVQPMEPLLPDPNMLGTFDLVGRDGLVYRGRTPPGFD